MSVLDKIEVFTRRKRENTSLKPAIKRYLKSQPVPYEWDKNWGSGVSKSGRPDVEIIALGRTHYFELKDPKGELSSTQKRLIIRYERLGKTVHVVDSLEQFIQIWRGLTGLNSGVL